MLAFFTLNSLLALFAFFALFAVQQYADGVATAKYLVTVVDGFRNAAFSIRTHFAVRSILAGFALLALERRPFSVGAVINLRGILGKYDFAHVLLATGGQRIPRCDNVNAGSLRDIRYICRIFIAASNDQSHECDRQNNWK